MKWALVNTVVIQITVGHWQGTWPNQIFIEDTYDADPGTIVNLIVYNGSDPYTPPDGTRLAEVPDDAQIGDTGY